MCRLGSLSTSTMMMSSLSDGEQCESNDIAIARDTPCKVDWQNWQQYNDDLYSVGHTNLPTFPDE
jgi:hypothetical protein